MDMKTVDPAGGGVAEVTDLGALGGPLYGRLALATDAMLG